MNTMISEEIIKILREAPLVSSEEYRRTLHELMGDDDS